MEDENKAAEGEKPQDAAGEPQDTQAGEGARPQEPARGEGTQSANVHKLERDVANRETRIKELEEQLAAAGGSAKTVEQRLAEVEEKLAASERALADEKVAGSLAALGCVNVKAARALLEDYEGDPAKLKEACPYLFGQTQQKGGPQTSTGGRPAGATASDELNRLRRLAGLSVKE